MNDDDKEDEGVDAYYEGRDAFRAGLTYQSNPHPSGTAECRFWDKGFCSEEKASVA